MNLRKRSAVPAVSPRTPPAASLHRSGAVARMLRMPVATLRVWERRYGVTQALLSPSGQRLYSSEQVQRLALIRQLTELGHAIGSMAPLDMAQLQQVAATHAQVLTATHRREPAQESARSPAKERVHQPAPPPARVWRLAIIGAALGKRLQRPALLRRLGAAVQLLGPFDDVAQAVAELPAGQVDALLLHEAHLQVDRLAGLDALAPAWAGLSKAVLYSFAPDPVCEALASAGVALLREPQPDAVLAQWLCALSLAPSASMAEAAGAVPATRDLGDAVPPRRWDDAALADFAGLSSTVACECPRHVAELLMQLTHFEAYSAACEQLSAADGELHTYLKQVAASSRARFEAALEYVALHEGLLLPPVQQPQAPSRSSDALQSQRIGRSPPGAT